MDLFATENEVNSFPEFGIESTLLNINGVQTNQQLITKDKNFVASLDNKYQVLPNEQVMEQMKKSIIFFLPKVWMANSFMFGQK